MRCTEVLAIEITIIILFLFWVVFFGLVGWIIRKIKKFDNVKRIRKKLEHPCTL